MIARLFTFNRLFWVPIALVVWSAVIRVELCAQIPVRPPNNDFSDARELVGDSGAVHFPNALANRQQGEPKHAGIVGGRSIWWSWTPSRAGIASFFTHGSTFDTIVAVYLGNELENLVEVAAVDDSFDRLTTLVTFQAEPGHLYRLAVDSANGETGWLDLQWYLDTEPATAQRNDLFTKRSRIRGPSGSVAASTLNAGVEDDEPDHVESPWGGSVWYSWIAPRDSIVDLDTIGSGIDTVLAVYTGDSLPALEALAASDDAQLGYYFGRWSSVRFEVTGGVEYSIAVGGAGGITGAIRLNWVLSPICEQPGVPFPLSPAPGGSVVPIDVTLTWTELEQGAQNVIYGVDHRREVYEFDSRRIRDAADSTAAVIRSANLFDNGDGTFTARSDQTYGEALNLCDVELYANQPRPPAICTAFLVGADLVMTAGHCLFIPEQCDATYFVFGFRMLDEQSAALNFDASQVYRCKEIVEEQRFTREDWALIRLDRAVPDRRPLQIRREGKIADEQTLLVIGHPAGIPMKISGGASVRDNELGTIFVTNLDTYAGNSGSPVLNLDSLEVEGLIVRGERDFGETELGCLVSLHCADHRCVGESAVRTTVFADRIPPVPRTRIYQVHFGPCGAMEPVGETEELRWPAPALKLGESYCWKIVSKDICGGVESPVWSFTAVTQEWPPFRRGEVSLDGLIDVTDAVGILLFLFVGTPLGADCKKAADVDDNGKLDITDPVALLTHLYLGGPPPPAPHPNCGRDNTLDVLPCVSYSPCGQG